ncbi:hypothetical protein [Solirubrobacter soli]|uniref:hypothetical protein n=1 Tax=Solirubrobacter soli TaxID=363832 RepID=UPI00146A4455|nr:hypothetical protein [Solirubrobacter soli]
MLSHVNRRLRVLTLLIALALPASAGAAPLAELPFQRVADGATCMAPTGAPGEMSRWAERGAEVLGATPDGLGRPALVPLGKLTGCPRAAAQPSGAAIVAGATAGALRVALREPGAATFGAPLTLAAAKNVYELSVAVSPNGDAVVLWAEYDAQRVRIRVARRDAGGAFGAPVELVPWRRATGAAGVLAGMSADGETVVLVRTPTGTAQRSGSTDAVRSGARGAPLGPPALLAPDLYGLALGVAPDGRVVVAAASGGSVYALERPRGGTLSAPQRLTDPLETVNPDQMALAFGADGRTVIAWHDDDQGTTGAAIREAGATGFSPRVEIVPVPKQLTGGSFGSGPPVVRPLAPLQSAVAPDGRVTVAWTDGDARIATLSGNAVVERLRLGSRLRDPEGLSLLALPDGRRALAWTNRDRFDEHAPARVHLALEGAPAAPELNAPQVTVRRPRQSALRPAQTLTLPIHCSAACDLNVSLAGYHGQAIQGSRTRAGTVDVELPPPDRAIAPVRPGPVRVAIRSSAPGARTVTRTIATPRLRRLPALPFPRIEAVHARRLAGGRVEVRWRMSSDARDTLVAVTGTRNRAESRDDDPKVDALWGERRRNYRLVLEDAADKRWVHVEVLALIGERRRTVTVRV